MASPGNSSEEALEENAECFTPRETYADDRLHAEVTAALERSEQRQQQEQQSKRQRAEESGSLRRVSFESTRETERPSRPKRK